MNAKIVLIPLASLAVIGAAALLTHGPAKPAPVCVEIIETPTVDTPEPPRRFARPPAPPMPTPRPTPAPVA